MYSLNRKILLDVYIDAVRNMEDYNCITVGDK